MRMTGLPEPNVATNAVRMSANLGFHLEPGRTQQLLQERAAFLLLITHLGERPDLLGSGGRALTFRFNALQQRGAIVPLRVDGGGQNDEKRQRDNPNSTDWRASREIA